MAEGGRENRWRVLGFQHNHRAAGMKHFMAIGICPGAGF